MTLGGLQRVDILPGSAPEEPPTLTLAHSESEEKQGKYKSFGAIKSLAFSHDGRRLALGGEDGSIEIVSWPALTSVRRWQASNKGIRNVDFSAAHNDGVLTSVDESGGRVAVWGCEEESSSTGEAPIPLAELVPPPELPRATFFRCKTAVDEDGIALYTAVKFKGKGYMLRWQQRSDGDIQLDPGRLPRPVTPAPICGFNISHNGNLLAAVTPEGDQCVVSTRTMRVVRYRKGAHMTFSTAVTFAPDDSAILSTSADASATLTRLGGVGGSSGMAFGLIAVLLVLIAVLLGMVRRLAEQSPDETVEVLRSLPLWVRYVVLPILPSSVRLLVMPLGWGR
jgi:prolactin regulatory element-binding protein